MSGETIRLLLCGLAAAAALVSSGCSAFHPVTGVPAPVLPDAYRFPVRSGMSTLDLSLLGQPGPANYRLDTGDVLGIYIDGVLGADVEAPPIAGPNSADVRPSLGYPVEVERDGTITLPIAGRIPVRNLTLAETREMLIRTFMTEPAVLTEEARVLVALQKPRTIDVIVIRQEDSRDTGLDRVIQQGGGDLLRRNIGQVVSLPAYENDVLHALTQTGGLPGLDAENAVYVIRQQGFRSAMPLPPGPVPPMAGGHSPLPLAACGPCGAVGAPHVIRIPMKVHPGAPLPFGPADVILQEGDVVFIESRTTDFFYTSGLLGGGQYQLPRDYDLDVLGALAIVQANPKGSVQTKSVGGFSALNKDVTVGASQLVILRPQPDGSTLPIEVDLYEAIHNPRERILIQPGDHLILQYTRLEACAAFIERHLFEGLVLGAASSIFYSR